MKPNLSKRRALVLGATGIVGSAITERLVADDWDLVCASRAGTAVTGARGVAVDLLDAAAAARALAACGAFTHVFFAAYLPAPTRAAEVPPNLALLANAVNAVEQTSPDLQKVVLITGAKFYGIQWGASKSPMRETDARQLPPNFYYDQEDFLRTAQAGKRWHWVHLIPPFISGYAVGNPMNVVMAVAVYAAISKELGLPLRFPGSLAGYNGLHHIADTRQMAAAAAWACDADAANNQVFNIANGDPSRWRNTWPVIAKHFGMELADPKAMPLADLMQEQQPLWQRMVQQHGLRATNVAKLVNWTWADYMLRTENDVLLELGKARRAGFHDCIDSEAALLDRIRELQVNRIIP